MKRIINLLVLAMMLSSARAGDKAADHITRDTIFSVNGIILISGDRLSTPGSFQPPVEIDIVAKTDSTDLRIAYAADQVIFNWEDNGQELRVDGGPANGLHKPGAGAIPTDQYVAIRWIVTPKRQAIYVDNNLRYEHKGDYSRINNCVSVFTCCGARVTVKSIQVRQLPTDAK
jgi:hypothetical protein